MRDRRAKEAPTCLSAQGEDHRQTVFGYGPNCDIGFCLGTRLGEGRGLNRSGKFCVLHLRKI